jgi:RNA polymerase sigma-70 factor (ECF subfamily)
MSNKLKDCISLTDKEIIKLSLADIAYFRCLFERYEPRLKVYIKRISGFNIEETEDIIQNSFIKIWKNLNNYDDSIEVSGFVFNIVHNETISYWRKIDAVHRLKDAVSRLNVTEEETQLTENENPELKQIIESMPQKYKEVIILRFFENMDYEEISYILKIPEGTVATRINRAKAYFAKKADKNKFNY